MRSLTRFRHASVLVGVLGALTTSALAADVETTPAANAQSADYVAGQKALEAKQWKLAVSHFRRATEQTPKSADAWNLYGYASRWTGDYDTAFKAYAQALAIDPKHRGALSYRGIAYVQTNDLARAREALGQVEAICGRSCEEYQLLAQAIAAHKPR